MNFRPNHERTSKRVDSTCSFPFHITEFGTRQVARKPWFSLSQRPTIGNDVRCIPVFVHYQPLAKSRPANRAMFFIEIKRSVRACTSAKNRDGRIIFSQCLFNYWLLLATPSSCLAGLQPDDVCENQPLNLFFSLLLLGFLCLLKLRGILPFVFCFCQGNVNFYHHHQGKRASSFGHQ